MQRSKERKTAQLPAFYLKFHLCDSFLLCKTSDGQIKMCWGYLLCKHVLPASFFAVKIAEILEYDLGTYIIFPKC